MADQANVDIFGQPTQVVQPQQSTPQGTGANVPTDELATLLGNIKNERGEPKYKTLQDALVALQHSQQFIPQLKSREQELEQQLRDAMAKVAKVDALEQTLLQLTQQQAPQAAPQAPAGLSREDVAALLEQRENAQKQIANLQIVTDKVKAVYGDKASENFYAKAAELGMSKDEFNAFAAQRPQAVLQLLGLDKQTQPARPASNGINTAAFQPQENSMIGRNPKQAIVGATTQQLREESDNARKMVDELHAQGKTINDLTNPKVYFQYFK